MIVLITLTLSHQLSVLYLSHTNLSHTLYLCGGRGERASDICSTVTVEGVPTAQVAIHFADKCGLELPIFRAVAAVLDGTLKIEVIFIVLDYPIFIQYIHHFNYGCCSCFLYFLHMPLSPLPRLLYVGRPHASYGPAPQTRISPTRRLVRVVTLLRRR